MKNLKPALALVRVSSTKQANEGESLDVQKKICIEASKNKGYEIIHTFEESYSGRKNERPVLESLFDYLEENQGQIEAVFIRDIDRFTRGGSYSYTHLKTRLLNYGTVLIDTAGIIQPTNNSLSDVGFEYDWSLRSPSRMAENIKADMANDEVSTILTRMIGQEIRNVKQGYRVRESPLGYKNVKIEDENGKKKTILEPDLIEGPWFLSMFKLKSEGILSDQEICDRVNAMGFKTRIQNRRDKITRKIIGKQGGKPLDTGMLQKYIKKPIYCGITSEEWTHNRPIKGMFDGLVSIDTFNRTNHGQIKVFEEPNGKVSVVYASERKQRMMKNPEYPFRFVVRCPKCGKAPLKGSASKGKMGKTYPAYHCGGKDHYFRVPVDKFHETLAIYLQNLIFKPEFLKLFEAVAMDTWRMKQKESLKLTMKAGENVLDLQSKQEHILEEYTNADSETVKKLLAKRLESIELEIANASDVRTQHEIDEQKIKAYLARAKYVVEHPSELLTKAVSMQALIQMWNFVFDELPTYEDLVGGTPKLSLIFELSKDSKVTENQLVPPLRIELRFWP